MFLETSVKTDKLSTSNDELAEAFGGIINVLEHLPEELKRCEQTNELANIVAVDYLTKLLWKRDSFQNRMLITNKLKN